MSAILLTPFDLLMASLLLFLDAALSAAFRLDLHRQIFWAAFRMVVQLLGVGYILHFIFRLNNVAATTAIIVVMALIAAREVAARPRHRLGKPEGYLISSVSVLLATFLTAGLAITTAIRPAPWYNPRYAIPLTGIILGSVLNAASITLDNLLGGLKRERATIEAQLSLGATFRSATMATLRGSLRKGMLPTINHMSASGLITLPGIMTGQVLAGMDPIEAVKYQILLMFLLAGSSGIAALSIAYLTLRRLTDERHRLRIDRLI